MTSVNSIGPVGRGAVGLGEGDGLAYETSDEGGASAGASVFLQPTENTRSRRQITIEVGFIR